MRETIQEGDYVVLTKNFDSCNMKIFAVEEGKVVHYGKLHFDPGALVGATYGSIYEISDGIMTRVDDFEQFDTELSAIFSNKMSNFDEKSLFSQEKILKKKKQKNRANIVTVTQPSLRLINEMLYARDKIGGLRPDILSQILTLSNIQSGTKCLVFDHNLGLMISAVMSRISPHGECIQLATDYEMVNSSRSTLRMLNLGDTIMENGLHAITLRDFQKVCLGQDEFFDENSIKRALGEEHLDRLAQLSSRAIRGQETNEKLLVTEASVNSIPGNLQQILIKKDCNRELRNRERTRASKLLKTQSLNSIIIITQNDHPLPILKMCFKFLMLSGQFVIYSDTVEPLFSCQNYLKSNSLAVSLNLSESWLRRYQVLPDRTRPEMNTSGIGGYLLSGTKALFGPKTSDDLGLDDPEASGGACNDHVPVDMS